MKERSHKYEVELSEEQRFALQHLLSRGNAPVRQQAHACILLKIDRNVPGPRWTDEQVAEASRKPEHRRQGVRQCPDRHRDSDRAVQRLRDCRVHGADHGNDLRRGGFYA